MNNVQKVDRYLEEQMQRNINSMYVATFTIDEMRILTELCVEYGYTYLSTVYGNVLQLVKKVNT